VVKLRVEKYSNKFVLRIYRYRAIFEFL